MSRPDYARVVALTERLSVSDLEKHRDELLRARTGSEIRWILEALEPDFSVPEATP